MEYPMGSHGIIPWNLIAVLMEYPMEYPMESHGIPYEILWVSLEILWNI
jgi:hypothetical protein